jgi:hypothetical protein
LFYAVLAWLTYVEAPQFTLMVMNILAPALLMGVIFLRVVLLRCPHCGGPAAKPYWKARPDREQYCAKCGERLVYDDEV